MNDYIVTFHSTHHALKAEKQMHSHIPEIDLIPTPREISSECGFCLIFKNLSFCPVSRMEEIRYDSCYTIIYSKSGGKNYEKAD